MVLKNKTDFRSSLKSDGSLSSILTLKLNNKEPSHKYEPSKALIDMSKNVTWEYNREHQSQCWFLEDSNTILQVDSEEPITLVSLSNTILQVDWEGILKLAALSNTILQLDCEGRRKLAILFNTKLHLDCEGRRKMATLSNTILQLDVREGGSLSPCQSQYYRDSEQRRKLITLSNTILQVDSKGRRKLATLFTQRIGVFTPFKVCNNSNISSIIVGKEGLI
ncbi:hypothetical protein DPMN_181082 [Dreissena polymorpha]|uniref:Uncharacterized protein n=1 Tax=Dreissena polymorpha TaxID=45954 RepID=A0A9D4DBN6_DREPO|nr:hypothetical protein DPMN_181082 [Dreissena polymorpha]